MHIHISYKYIYIYIISYNCSFIVDSDIRQSQNFSPFIIAAKAANFGAKAAPVEEKSCQSPHSTSVDFTLPTVRKP